MWKLKINTSSCTQWSTALCGYSWEGLSTQYMRWNDLPGGSLNQGPDILGVALVESMQCLE